MNFRLTPHARYPPSLDFRYICLGFLSLLSTVLLTLGFDYLQSQLKTPHLQVCSALMLMFHRLAHGQGKPGDETQGWGGGVFCPETTGLTSWAGGVLLTDRTWMSSPELSGG